MSVETTLADSELMSGETTLTDSVLKSAETTLTDRNAKEGNKRNLGLHCRDSTAGNEPWVTLQRFHSQW